MLRKSFYNLHFFVYTSFLHLTVLGPQSTNNVQLTQSHQRPSTVLCDYAEQVGLVHHYKPRTSLRRSNSYGSTRLLLLGLRTPLLNGFSAGAHGCPPGARGGPLRPAYPGAGTRVQRDGLRYNGAVADALTLMNAVVDLARTQSGVRESGGRHRGPQVDVYIRSIGLDPTQGAYPWCAAYVYWLYDQASKTLGIPN